MLEACWGLLLFGEVEAGGGRWLEVMELLVEEDGELEDLRADRRSCWR